MPEREKLKQIIKDNDMDSIMAPNKRNTKDLEKLKNKNLSYKHKQKLKKRHIVENCFSWLAQYTPRFYRVFTRNAFNFLNEVYIIATKIILAKFWCVYCIIVAIFYFSIFVTSKFHFLKSIRHKLLGFV